MNKIEKRKIEQMRIGDILDHPLNPKTHPDYQIQAIDASIEEIGKFDNPKAYYSERNGGKLTLFHGHGRKQRDPDDIWEVDIFVDYTDEQADKAILFGDPTVGLAIKDHDLHEQLRQKVDTDSEILQAVMDDNKSDYSNTDFSDLESQMDEFGDIQDVTINITVPKEHAEYVSNWLSNGELNTGPGRGTGVLKKCGLL